MNEVKRCDWALKSKIEQEYHDKEWGIPIRDDRQLFKMLIPEGKHAGLSWATILAQMDTLYAFMQSVGLVDDHLVHCAFRNR